MHTEKELITPERAHSILQDQVSLRKSVPWIVRTYARVMAKGLWCLIPSGILLSVDGQVLDGLTRLRAIISAGVSVPMLVTYDVIF